MTTILKKSSPIDFEEFGFQTRLSCSDEQHARTICGLHLQAYEQGLQPELSRIHSEIDESVHASAALHSHLYERSITVNDAAMITQSFTCSILCVLAVLAGIACFAGNITTWRLFGMSLWLTLPLALAMTALPVIIGHLAFESFIVKHKGLQALLIAAAALLCFAGAFRLAQARLLMAEKTTTSTSSSSSYVDGMAADAQPSEDNQPQQSSEGKVRQMFGEAMLMMMIAAELMFGYLVGVLTKKQSDEDYRAWKKLKALNKQIIGLQQQDSYFRSSVETAKRHCMAGILRAQNVMQAKRKNPYYRALGCILLCGLIWPRHSIAQQPEHYEGILIDTSGSISKNGQTNELFQEYLIATKNLLLSEPPNSRVSTIMRAPV